MLRIAKWDETFENAKTRKLIGLDYIHVPTGVDSAGYLELMSHGADGIVAYGVFLAICQWSGTCRPHVRGWIARSDGRPLALRQLAMLLRMPQDVVGRSLEILTSEDVGWLEEVVAGPGGETSQQSATDLPEFSQPSASDLPVVSQLSPNHPPVISQPSASHLPTISQPSASDLPVVSVQGEERRGEEGRGRERIERESYGNRSPDVVVPQSMDSERVHAAVTLWKRHLEHVAPDKAIIPNSPQEQMFWQEISRMGPDRFLAAVEYSVARKYLSLVEKPPPRTAKASGGGGCGMSARDRIRAVGGSGGGDVAR